MRPLLEWRNCGGILEDLVSIGIIPIKLFGTHDFIGIFSYDSVLSSTFYRFLNMSSNLMLKFL
jgi:hypothetical protein